MPPQPEDYHAIASMIPNAYYKKHLRYITRLLSRTRFPFLQTSPLWINVLQSGMLKNLFRYQQCITQGKRLEEAPETPLADKPKIRLRWQMNVRLARAVQVIGDGIAWRNLNYRRAHLRLFSENASPGYLTKHEVDSFSLILKTNRYLILVNDLTRYLRIADLTLIRDKAQVIFLESKQQGNEIKDVSEILRRMRRGQRAPTSQEYRQLVAQFALVDNAITLPHFESGRVTEERHEIVDLSFPIKHYLKQVERMLAQAWKKSYAIECLEPGYLVSVTSFDRTVGKLEVAEKKLQRYKEALEAAKEECLGPDRSRVIHLNTYDSLFEEGGHFVRNSTPLSVLPFPAKHCARLILGFTRVDVYYKMDMVQEAFVRAGWRVEKDDSAALYPATPARQYRPMEDYGNRPSEAFIKVMKDVDNSTYYATVPLTLLMIALSAFYKTSFLVDSIETQFRNSRRDRRSRSITNNYPGEVDVLH